MEKIREYLGTLAGTVVILGFLLLVAWGIESGTPNSTAGIVNLGNNKATVPVGETMVLTHKSGKTKQVWKVTYDGKETVSINCGTLCNGDSSAKLCGVGCTVKSGWWDHFYSTLESNGTVTVEWPWGWNYRSYRP